MTRKLIAFTNYTMYPEPEYWKMGIGGKKTGVHWNREFLFEEMLNQIIMV